MKARVNDRKARAEKATAQTSYNLAHKEVRKNVRKDKQAYIDNMSRYMK